MAIIIRQEQPADYRETENITREAFWNHFSPGCNEHYLLHIMRDCPSFVPQLDLVALDEGKIVGNVVHTHAVIRSDNGKEHQVLTLGPIAVLPQYQGRGMGGQLIKHSRSLAREMGYCAVLLCGDPAYYSRHGFVAAESFGVRTADNMYAVALQACELYDGALSGLSGRYYEDGIYEMDDIAAAEYDKSFSAKPLVKGTPSQKRFDELVVLRRPAEC